MRLRQKGTIRTKSGKTCAGTPWAPTREQIHDALRKQAAFASRRRKNAPVCFRRESESTVSNEKPKRGSAPPPGNTFRAASVPRNWLVPVILLSIREWNSYGYELMQRASAFGYGAMNPGTLYRTLRKMEKDGVVESSWETSRGGPARRMYAITDAGEAHLGFWAKSLEQYQHSMNDFFRLYAGRPSHTNENEDN
jgi:PadR family transcriptional regulator, regulatory protein PadR